MVRVPLFEVVPVGGTSWQRVCFEGFSRPKTPRCFAFHYGLYPTEVSLLQTFFTASNFPPTLWSTADEKAVFGNTLRGLLLTGHSPRVSTSGCGQFTSLGASVQAR
jgi:hypothetical protein